MAICLSCHGGTEISCYLVKMISRNLEMCKVFSPTLYGDFFLFLLVVTAKVLTQVRTTFMPAEILAILSCYLPHCTDFQKYEYALFLESESTGLHTHIRCTQIWKNDLPLLFYRKDWSALWGPPWIPHDQS